MTESNDGDQSASPTLKAGERVDKYVIVEQVGAGGLGVVYEANDPLLSRRVAIKQVLPKPGEDANELTDRVMQEARAHKTAAESQPRFLARFIEVIRDARGPMIVTEFVPGRSLEQRLMSNSSPMPIREVQGLVAAAATGLKAIHERGLIHRDIKPSNLLLPDTGGLKITDFGLAAAMVDRQQASTGSVRYMAPELQRGDPADGRADIYSLGMVAYEMLAGRGGFEQAFRMIMRDQRHQAQRWNKWHTNPRATATPLTQINPDVPEPLSNLVADMMAKNPSDRPEDIDDLLSQLAIIAAGGDPNDQTEPMPDQADTIVTQQAADTAELPARRPLPWVLASTLVVWIVLGVVLAMGIKDQRQTDVQDRREQAFDMVEKAKLAFAEQRYVDALATYQQLVSSFEPGSNAGEIGQAGVLRTQARLHMEAGRYAQARDALNQAKEMGVYPDGTLDDELREARRKATFAASINKIEQLIANGEFGQATTMLRELRETTMTTQEDEQIKELTIRMSDQRALSRVESVLAEARRRVSIGRRDDAIALLRNTLERTSNEEVRQMYEQLRSQQNYEQLIAGANQAVEQNDLESAVLLLRQASNLPSKPDDAKLDEQIRELEARQFYDQGQNYLRNGRTEDAAEAFRSALGLGRDTSVFESANRELDRIDSTNQRVKLIRAGDRALARGRYEQAVNQYENALELGQDPEVEGKLRQAKVRLNVQKALQDIKKGRTTEALALLDAARKLDPDDHAITAAMDKLQTRQQYENLLAEGDAARKASQFGDAKRAYRRAREMMDTPVVRKRLEQTEYDHLVAQARSYMAVEEFNSARAMLRTAYQIKASDEVKHMLRELGDPLLEDLDENL